MANTPAIEHVRHIDRLLDAHAHEQWTLRCERNRLIKAATLPNELLELIFCELRSFRDDRAGGRFSLHWLSVTYVCRHWRDAALTITRLWRYIPMNDLSPFRYGTSAWTHLFLERSGLAPLSVSGNFWYSASTKYDMKMMHHILDSHISRLRFFHIEAPALSMQGFIRKMRSHAPLLEDLCIDSQSLPRTVAFSQPVPGRKKERELMAKRTNRSYGLHLPHDIFNGHTPRLSSLKLCTCIVDWTAPIFSSNLRVLHLRDLTPMHRPSMAQLIALLNGLPALEVLCLADVIPPLPPSPLNDLFGNDESIEANTTELGKVMMENLRSLELHGTATECVHVLRHLSYHSCVNLHLSFSEIGDSVEFEQTFYELGQHTHRVANRLYVDAARFQYDEDFDVLELRNVGIMGWSTTTTQQLNIEMQWPGGTTSLHEAVRCIRKLVPLQEVSYFVINPTGNPPATSDLWFDVFGDLPLTTLRLEKFTPDGLLSAMAASEVDGSTHVVKLWPRLQRFGVEKVLFHESSLGWFRQLRRCLERRHDMGSKLERFYVDQCCGLHPDWHCLKELEKVVEYEWIPLEFWDGGAWTIDAPQLADMGSDPNFRPIRPLVQRDEVTTMASDMAAEEVLADELDLPLLPLRAGPPTC